MSNFSPSRLAFRRSTLRSFTHHNSPLINWAFFSLQTLEDSGLRGFARFSYARQVNANNFDLSKDLTGLAVSERLHYFAGRTVGVALLSTSFSLGLADSLLNRVRRVNRK